MLITLKTLQEDLFTVEVDPEDTVRTFKEKIEEVKGKKYPAKYIKLMYAGKFLLDCNRVCDYNLQEKKFVIAVVKEPKKPVTEGQHDPNGDQVLRTDNPNGVEQDNAGGNNLSYEDMVERIEELGFTRIEAEHALRTCFNNPDRAVDFLMSTVTGSRPEYGEGTSTNGRMPTVEEANARFLQHICRPDFTNPNTIAMPSERRILQLFNEYSDDSGGEGEPMEAREEILDSFPPGLDPVPGPFPVGLDSCSNFAPSVSARPRNFQAGSRSGFQDAARNEPVQHVQPPGEISEGLFEERDQEAIERLRQLGFPDRKVIEAYFICDKDENNAADYLFSQYD